MAAYRFSDPEGAFKRYLQHGHQSITILINHWLRDEPGSRRLVMARTNDSGHNVDLHGVTLPLTFAVEHAGHEDVSSGSHLRGFVGTTSFARKDYRIEYEPGPAS